MNSLQLSSIRYYSSSVRRSSRMTVCGISSFSFSSSRATSTTRSSSLSATIATKRFRNQFNNNSNILQHNKTSPRPMMMMIRTKFANSQKRLQRDDVIKSSKATGAATTIRQQQQQQAKKQGTKKRILTITAATTIAFFTINAFGTYTHYHDDLFTKYYPLPFALDVGIGYSMIPTINPYMNEVYLRDTRIRNIIYNKGDVVTIYNPYTESIVTKRIVGMGGDEICLYGEFAVNFSKLKQQQQLKQQKKEEQQKQQQQGEYYGGGVPLDVRFDPPFCQKQHQQQQQQQQQQLSCENNIQYDATMKVPPNHVWVEGDNPLQSTDSRHYGPLPISALRGRVVLRLWPLMGEHEHDHDDNDDSSSNDKEGRRSCSNKWFYRLSEERPNPFQEKED